MRIRKVRLAIAATALGAAALMAMAPHPMITHTASWSLDPGWYVRIPFAEIEPGSIVQFPIPERALSLAERGNMDTSIPLLKRVEAITHDGRLIVKGDCGGTRSLDSGHFGPINPGEVNGVFTPLPFATEDCQRWEREEKKKEREDTAKREIWSQIKRFYRKVPTALSEIPSKSITYVSRKPLPQRPASSRKLTRA